MANKEESPSGSNFYLEQDLVPMMIYVPISVRERLKKEAKKQGRTLQKTLLKMVENHFKK